MYRRLRACQLLPFCSIPVERPLLLILKATLWIQVLIQPIRSQASIPMPLPTKLYNLWQMSSAHKHVSGFSKFLILNTCISRKDFVPISSLIPIIKIGNVAVNVNNLNASSLILALCTLTFRRYYVLEIIFRIFLIVKTFHISSWSFPLWRHLMVWMPGCCVPGLWEWYSCWCYGQF